MQIVIPLAGKDPQFSQFSAPKPLIPVEGKPLIKRCTDSLSYPFDREDYRLIFVVLQEHDTHFNIGSRLKEIYGDEAIIVPIQPTEGAACSVLEAKEYINNDEPLAIYLADILFEGSLEEAIEHADPSIHGFIPTFKSSQGKYSYAVADEEHRVSRVAEKEVISDNASAGFYYFRHGRDFVWGAEEMIRKDLRVNGWFYICPVYNQLIQRGDKVKIIPTVFRFGLGSPEEIEAFRRNHKKQG